MKKTLLLVVLIGIMAVPMFAADGSFKLGGMVGNPSAATMGYRFSDLMEFNALVGIGWGYYTYSLGEFLIGANLLFTLVTFDIGGQKFPLSLGPQVNVGFGLNSVYRTFRLDGLADLRLEYTFEQIPLNLFTEVGLGIRYNTSNYTYYWYDDEPSAIRFGWSASVGARYVF